MRKSNVLQNILGAFSDAATLFPLIALLSKTPGFSLSLALLTTGVLYLVSAWVFRIPMAVQPLKSIAIASVAIGASFSEIRVSALLLGMLCVLASFFDVNRIATKVPDSVIHQLQVGLGVLLVLQGIQAGFGYGILILVGLMVLLPEFRGIPILGLVATSGFLYSLSRPLPVQAQLLVSSESSIRPSIVLSLLIPQLVLTSANSVLATRNVCERYFGAKNSSRVTIKNLLLSIGIGNVAVAAVGGMPFCHGSGGVTAHVRGGSSRAWSTALMGLVLIFISALQEFLHLGFVIYPPVLISSLLVAIGVFHLQLAKPMVGSNLGWWKLAMALVVTLWTRNLLYVLAASILFEFSVSRLSLRRMGI